MTLPKEFQLTHTGVWVVKKDHVIVPTIVDRFAEERRRHALVFHWKGQDYRQQTLDDFICGVCGIAGPPTEVFSVGANGNVYGAIVSGKTVFFKEKVDRSSRGPDYLRTLRCVRLIDGAVYAAGMARMVYRRIKRNAWVAMDQGPFVPRGKIKEAVGFLDIDGFSAHDLCAVGYKGEIWHYDGKWHAQKSPTDRALTRVIPLDSGDWVAVGLAGTILTGRAGRWQEIKQSATEMDFWGGVTFKGQVILATGEGLFTLQGKKVKPLNIGVKGSRTTGFLHAAEGVLWSVGAKDIFRSEDGVKWKRVPNP